MPSPDGGDERGARPRRHTCACTPRPARHGDNDRIPWHRLPRTPEWQTLSKFLMRRARRRRRTGGRRRRRRRGRRGGLARRIDKSSIDETLARTGTPGPRACLGNGRTDMRPKKRGKPATALCARTAPGRARRKGLTARTGGRWRGCLKRSSSRPKRRRRAQEPITRRSQHAGAGGS
ncbi:unnamed protein product [Prorocentrum cordatum]|uniref:Uncharacterized protein n=1 Tax=Prorocentrum cordatum TaxID=2364126 RepID=A0ABN9Q0L4_9DINO|nr:unnamed protein product [Polarella glacialis]